MKLNAALFKENQVESPINPLGSIPGPGYASPGFKFYSAVGSQDSEKQAYINFGKKSPTPRDKMMKAGMCPECGRKLMPGSKFCQFCKRKKRGVGDSVDNLPPDVDPKTTGTGGVNAIY